VHIARLVASWIGALSLDENGTSLQAEPIPEASRLDVLARKGSLEGWTHATSVRVLLCKQANDFF
jgi:hypothetical protein